jgi:hypothetical protein
MDLALTSFSTVGQILFKFGVQEFVLHTPLRGGYQKIFVIHSVQSGSGVHPAPYPMGSGVNAAEMAGT